MNQSGSVNQRSFSEVLKSQAQNTNTEKAEKETKPVLVNLEWFTGATRSIYILTSMVSEWQRPPEAGQVDSELRHQKSYQYSEESEETVEKTFLDNFVTLAAKGNHVVSMAFSSKTTLYMADNEDAFQTLPHVNRMLGMLRKIRQSTPKSGIDRSKAREFAEYAAQHRFQKFWFRHSEKQIGLFTQMLKGVQTSDKTKKFGEQSAVAKALVLLDNVAAFLNAGEEQDNGVRTYIETAERIGLWRSKDLKSYAMVIELFNGLKEGGKFQLGEFLDTFCQLDTAIRVLIWMIAEDKFPAIADLSVARLPKKEVEISLNSGEFETYKQEPVFEEFLNLTLSTAQKVVKAPGMGLEAPSTKDLTTLFNDVKYAIFQGREQSLRTQTTDVHCENKITLELISRFVNFVTSKDILQINKEDLDSTSSCPAPLRPLADLVFKIAHAENANEDSESLKSFYLTEEALFEILRSQKDSEKFQDVPPLYVAASKLNCMACYALRQAIQHVTGIRLESEGTHEKDIDGVSQFCMRQFRSLI